MNQKCLSIPIRLLLIIFANKGFNVDLFKKDKTDPEDQLNSNKESNDNSNIEEVSQKAVDLQLNGIYNSLKWYKMQYAKLTTLLLMSIVLLITSVVGNYIQYIKIPSPVYFQVDTNLRLAKIKPLSDPLFSNEVILNWTATTVKKTLSMDFLHYRDDLNEVKNLYTNKSYKELITSLTKSNILSLIKKDNLSVKVSLLKAPIITNSGVSNKAMTWKVTFPISLDYVSSNGEVSISQKLEASVLVKRANILKYKDGLIINQLLLIRA